MPRAPAKDGVSWYVAEAPGKGTWSHSGSVREAFEAVQALPAAEQQKGFFVSIRFASVPEAVDLLRKAGEFGVGGMGSAQWMFGNLENYGWTPAYYNPIRWSRLANIQETIRQLEALPVRQQPIRLNIQFSALGEAIARVLQGIEQTQAPDATEEVAELKRNLHEKDTEIQNKALMIQDLQLQLQEMVHFIASPYFLQDKSRSLPPLALRILSYWFGQEYDGAAVLPKQYRLWFGKSDETDEELRRYFGGHLDAAAGGLYDSWTEEPLGIVALVILLDQFPRSIFRGTELSFAYDWKAQMLVSDAIREGQDDKLTAMERVWLYLVFTHSEDIKLQEECVKLARERLGGLEENFHNMLTSIFGKHLTMIEKFGRFPHRNEFMCRTSTPEEDELVNDFRVADNGIGGYLPNSKKA